MGLLHKTFPGCSVARAIPTQYCNTERSASNAGSRPRTRNMAKWCKDAWEHEGQPQRQVCFTTPRELHICTSPNGLPSRYVGKHFLPIDMPGLRFPVDHPMHPRANGNARLKRVSPVHEAVCRLRRLVLRRHSPRARVGQRSSRPGAHVQTSGSSPSCNSGRSGRRPSRTTAAEGRGVRTWWPTVCV